MKMLASLLMLSCFTAFAEDGLKAIDYEDKTTESSTPAAPSMSAEEMQNIMETVNKAKAAQREQVKALKELDDEE